MIRDETTQQERQVSDMAISAAALAQTPLRPAVCSWYTLAHEQTMPASVCLDAATLEEFADALASAGQEAPAARVAQIAREVALGALGERYVWAFRRLGDALTALRANHRSDYRAYPRPQSVREASLDRLHRRFPLPEYPRTTALLFMGMRVCDDPRLGADPSAESLASLAPGVIAPEDWVRYTFCGFQQGVALVRVSASSRWLRIGGRALEDAWAEAREAADAPHTQRSLSPLKTAETLARDALVRAAPADAFLSLDDAPASPPPATDATATVSRTRRRVLPGAARATRTATRALGA